MHFRAGEANADSIINQAVHNRHFTPPRPPQPVRTLMYAGRATQFAKSIGNMACSIQKQPSQPAAHTAATAATAATSTTGATATATTAAANAMAMTAASAVGGIGGSGAGTVPSTPKANKAAQQRGSLPTDVHQPPLEFQWPPPLPVSSHTSNLRLNMMNQDPKDLHTARAIIEELRSKVRFQTEHIMKWRKAYAMQVSVGQSILW